MKTKEMVNELFKFVNMWEDDVDYGLFSNDDEMLDIYNTCWHIDTLIEELRDDLSVWSDKSRIKELIIKELNNEK